MNLKNFGFLCSLTVFSPTIVASQLNIELTSEYESWATGLGSDATAILGGVGMGYYSDDYFAGGGFVVGNYGVENDSSMKFNVSILI